VPCVTSLRSVPKDCATLTQAAFARYFRDAGRPCWLLNSEVEPSFELAAYLRSVPEADRDTSTCRAREIWWRFSMPKVPQALIASGFKGRGTKAIANPFGARAVGSVYGIHAPSAAAGERIALALRNENFAAKVVAHSNGLHKLEVNQINTVIASLTKR
jgi:hypothetical protein